MVDYVWEQMSSQIEKGLRHGQGDSTTSLELKMAIQRGDMTLWVVHEGENIQALIVLSVSVHAAGRKLFVELLAGTGMDEWVGELEGLLKDYRDLLGAFCIEASCRRGLAEKLKRRNWKTKAVVMECPQ